MNRCERRRSFEHPAFRVRSSVHWLIVPRVLEFINHTYSEKGKSPELGAVAWRRRSSEDLSQVARRGREASFQAGRDF